MGATALDATMAWAIATDMTFLGYSRLSEWAQQWGNDPDQVLHVSNPKPKSP